MTDRISLTKVFKLTGFFLILFLFNSFTETKLNPLLEEINSQLSLPDSSDYEDILCNGWVYALLSSYEDSCLIDSTITDTVFNIPVEVGDSVINYIASVNVVYIYEACYDYRFGVAEKNNQFSKYYLQSTVTSYDTIDFRYKVVLFDSICVTNDQIPDSLTALVPSVEQLILGQKLTTFINCDSYLESICFSDTICGTTIDSIFLDEILETQSYTGNDSIGPTFPYDSSLQLVELWKYGEREQLLCSDTSRRVSPCNDCDFELIQSIELIPDNCEESQLAIVLVGEYSYDYCDINTIEVDKKTFSIDFEIQYLRANSFDYCDNCGQAFTDTIFLGPTPQGNYDFRFFDSRTDTLIYSKELEIKNCFTPVCIGPDIGQLETSFITESSALLTVEPDDNYSNYIFEFRNCDSTNWMTSTTIVQNLLLPDLQADTEYCWRVAVVCDNGLTSTFSEIVSFTTLPAESCEPDSTDTVIISDVTSSSVTFQINLVSADSIQIRIGECGTGIWQEYPPTAAFAFEIENLEADTEYCFEYSFICSNGHSSEWTQNSDTDGSSFMTLMSTSNQERITQQILNIYPNPFDNHLIINIENKTDYTGFKLMDITGSLIHENTMDNSYTLDTSNLQSGLYLIEIYNGQTRNIIPVVKL